MGVTNLAKQMGSYTQDIPGTKASKSKLRRLLLAMVRHIEIETRLEVPRGADAADISANEQLGDVPCLFGTLASQRYNWDDVIRTIAEVEGIDDYKVLTSSKRRELVNKYPLFVAWYCAVRLELGLKAVAVPYFGASGYVGVFEWSPTGGMVHLHYIFWKRNAPRFDLRAEDLEYRAEQRRKAGVLAGQVQECKVEDVVDFFTQYVTEWSVNYDDKGEPHGSYVAERVNESVPHVASRTSEEMLHLLEDGNEEARHEYYARLVRTEHNHDFHYPHPTGPPNPSQPCARLLKGTKDMWYCANGYPRDVVSQISDQNIAQDAVRKELWRCHLCRNYTLMNCHLTSIRPVLRPSEERLCAWKILYTQ